MRLLSDQDRDSFNKHDNKKYCLQRRGEEKARLGEGRRGEEGRGEERREVRRGEERRTCPYSKNSPFVSYKVLWLKPDETQKKVHRQEGEESNLQHTRHLEERRSGGEEEERSLSSVKTNTHS